jgi:hypothetical protein
MSETTETPTEPTTADFLDDPEYRSLITQNEWLSAHLLATLIFLEEKFGAENGESIAQLAMTVYAKFMVGNEEESE